MQYVKSNTKPYQSNNLEYTTLANVSLLTAAESGSSHFVIVSSLVTITRLQRESSSALTSHLIETYELRSLVFLSYHSTCKHVNVQVKIT